MHELSLAENMRELIIREAEKQNFKAVKHVIVEIGQLSHVEAEAMQFCFKSVMMGSPAEHATLEIRQTPGQAKCPSCGHTGDIAFRYDPCSHCGAFGQTITAGDTVRMVSMRVN